MKIIISKSDVGTLLKTTDTILNKYTTDDGDIPEKLKGLASLSVIKRLTSQKSFSVCDVTDIADMNDVQIPAELRKYLHSLHCVDYADMHPETKEYLIARIVDLFRGNIAMANSDYELSR